MTNKEVYRIIRGGDADKIKNILPNHYMAKKEKFVLLEGKTGYGLKFKAINTVTGLDGWYLDNYKISGKHSDELTIILMPYAPNVRLEIRDGGIYKALFIFGPGLFVDITHNIHFLNSVPLVRIPSDRGYIHGAIVSDLPDDELYQLIISPIPDERILNYKFVVTYAQLVPQMFDKIDDMFTTLRNKGFETASIIQTTIPKWSRAIESAKILAGSGNVGYECSTVLTAYSDIKMIDLFSSTDIHKWGVTTQISPTALIEVVGISWDTVGVDGRVGVVPVISFKYGNYNFPEVNDPNIMVDNEHSIFHVRIVDFNINNIGNYCVGDVLDRNIETGELVRRFGSKNTPLITQSCPKCGYAVSIENNKLFCVNTKCPAVVLANLKMWMDKFCPETDIHLIEAFLLKYEIANIGDLYTVIDSGDKFDPEYSPIYYGVTNSREAPDEFLHMLMPFLTIDQCRSIATSFSLLSSDPYSSIKHIFAPSTLARCVGDEQVVDKILEFLDTNRITFTRAMCCYYAPPSHPAYSKLYKKTFFIDGLLYDKDRIKYERIINNYYGRVVANLAPYITGFIYGKYVDRAILDAVEELSTHKDVAIYSEEEFNKLVDQANGGT